MRACRARLQATLLEWGRNQSKALAALEEVIKAQSKEQAAAIDALYEGLVNQAEYQVRRPALAVRPFSRFKRTFWQMIVKQMFRGPVLSCAHIRSRSIIRIG